ncbi:MAG TPA: DUF1343 domain-containing protein [Gemmatimonadaceae bacterium]|nr:DUF1343 domain-containing protein [Gemmatimonadaceae bacterium]
MTRQSARRRALAVLALTSVAGCATTAQSTPTPAVGAQRGEVLLGVEVLLRDSLHLLRDKRVGLITNHTGRDRQGTSTIDLLHRAPGVRLVALFGPEHGIRGAAQAGEKVSSTVDSATRIPVYSLYGETRVPTAEMLGKVDVLVYDIQDVGARVYTYPWTMALSAEAAGKAGKRFIVLDRPNPIRGDRVGGGILDTAFRSFVGQYPVALRYGFTPGELLRYLVGTGQVKADISVVPMQGWRRSMWWEETGIPWVAPSPNLRTVDAALLYPGTVFIEGTTLSEGRGTDKPFQLVGAKWLTDAGAIARALNERRLPGVRFDSTSRTIEKGQKWGGETIPMVEITVTDRNAVKALEVGAYLMRAIHERHRAQWEWKTAHFDRLAGGTGFRAAIESGDLGAYFSRIDAQTASWLQGARAYWLYQ